ncbi:MAG: hypothetical protein JST70_08665 [Bacteroidetes bacterium]|nr:hypothetical protein [Bacteroidota bacterium]
MMSYEEFANKVSILQNGDEKWLHVLPEVPAEHRMRFIKVLESGIDIPLAFDLVLVTRAMDDAAFEARWRDARYRKG